MWPRPLENGENGYGGKHLSKLICSLTDVNMFSALFVAQASYPLIRFDS
jgi:hypothetical protein